MGIKDLTPTLKEHAPDGLRVVKMKDLRGSTIAIDMSVFLYKFVKAAGEENWLGVFTQFLCWLKRARVRMICVFDGPSPPIEKREEQARRRADMARSAQILVRMKEVRRDVHAASVAGLMPSREIVEEVRAFLSRARGVAETDYTSASAIQIALSQVIDRREIQAAPVTANHTTVACDVARRVFGLCTMQADGEAESVCAWLAVKGLADAVLTEDTDVLAYGCPVMLAMKDFKMYENKLHAIVFADVCQQLDMTPAQFTDLCILLSCDYNSRVRGWVPSARDNDASADRPARPIGAKGAMAMIQTHGSLEACAPYIENISLLKIERCRELFSFSDVGTIPEITAARPVDAKTIEAFFDDNHVNVEVDIVMKAFASTVTINEAGGKDEEEDDDDPSDEDASSTPVVPTIDRCYVLERVISGGQIGAARAGLQAAHTASITTGGTAPPDFMTSNGSFPELGTKYGLCAMDSELSSLGLSALYVMWSMTNVDDADGTIAFRTQPSDGTDKTIEYCETGRWGSAGPGRTPPSPHRPYIVIRDISYEAMDSHVKLILYFLKEYSIRTLNVVGHYNDQSYSCDEYGERVYDMLERVFLAVTAER